MMIVQWHPKFNHYLLNNKDTLLVSDSEELLVPHQKYQGFEQINGHKSLYDISRTFLDITSGATFYNQVEYFLKKKLLIESEAFPAEQDRWRSRGDTPLQAVTLHNTSLNYAVYSFNQVQSNRVEQWLGLLHDWHSEIPYLSQEPISYLLLDDFLMDNVDLWSSFEVLDLHKLVLVKITGNCQWVSPVFNSQEPNTFHRFIKQLWNNRPLRKLLHALWSEVSHTAPYKTEESNITAYQARYLKRLLIKQLQGQQKLVIFNLESSESEYHPVSTYIEPQYSFADQLNEAIQLTSTPIMYDGDGGSRSQPAAKTLAALKPLISPITGVITHLSAINTSNLDSNNSDENSINIYQSAFFKTPTNNPTNHLNLQDFVQVSLGKGVSHEQSQVSALCETLERYAALSQGDELIKKSFPENLDAPYFTYQQLSPFSEKQYAEFATLESSTNKHGVKQSVVPYTNTEIAWTPAWSLHQIDQTGSKKVWLPLTTVFGNTGLEEEQYGRWHSNGCAAGNTLEEAILQALLELIERDAVAIWWYNQLRLPMLDKACIPEQVFHRLDQTLTIHHDYWMFDLTNDIQIPCVAAIARNKQSGGLTMGFGAHLEKGMAAQRALTELCQLIPVREQNRQTFDFDTLKELNFLSPHQNHGVKGRSVPAVSYSKGDLKDDIEQITKRFENLGLEAFAINYSRAGMPIKTAKVVVPGLCHIWPQLANQRLYQTPLLMGWLNEINNEATINPTGLLI